MPNWCSNTLEVFGTECQIKHFRKEISGVPWQNTFDLGSFSEFTFNSIIPVPKKLIKKSIKDASNSEWYDFCCDSWGTKWDATDVCFSSQEIENKVLLTIHFETAWSPPMGIFMRMATKFKHLDFSAFRMEEGMAFKGSFVVEKGIIVEECDSEMTLEDYHELGYHEDEGSEDSNCLLCILKE